MFHCFKIKSRSKSKNPINNDLKPPIGPTQSPESQQTIALNRTAFGNPHDASPAVAQQGSLPPQARDLWQEAFTRLDEDKKVLLSKIETPQGPQTVEQIAEQAKQSYLEHEERGWKISRAKGRPDINLRATFKKALLSILSFKELISAGIAFDPTGHASAAWTIVSLGLQMAQNDTDMRKSVFETCGLLAENLALLAAIEASYRERTVRDSSHLEATMIAVYVAILALSAEIVHENSTNAGQRIMKSFAAVAKQPLHDFIETVQSKKAILREWTEIIEHQYRTQEREELHGKVASTLAGIEQMAQQVSNVTAKILTAEEQNILSWLSKYSFSDSHISAASRQEPISGACILSLPQYEEWKTSDRSLLWLYGKSGCGKSILCSSIINNLGDLCAQDSGYALAYWYFTFSNRDSIDIDNLLSSIIRQLCAGTQTLPNNVRELWKKHHMAGSRPTRATLIETLNIVIAGLGTVNQHALVVLDALDEYPLMAERQQTSGRGDVMAWLEQIWTNHPNAHILVLSRDENDIRSKMRGAMEIDVARCVEGDLDLFIRKSVNRIVQEKPWKESYKPQLLSRFEVNSERRFRWASLVLRKFSECKTHEKMQEALTTLPDSLEAVYAEVLSNKISKEYMKEARLMLIWLSYSLRPLTLQELACAASLPEPRDVLDICTSSLVSLRPNRRRVRKPEDKDEHDEMQQIVQLDHFSVQEYLTSERLLASKETTFFYATPLVAHLTIAEISVSRLLKTNKVDLMTGKGIEATLAEDSDAELCRAGKDHLLGYSISWYRHIQEADIVETNAPDSKNPDLRAHLAVTEPQPESMRAQIHKIFCEGFSQSIQNWLYLLDKDTWLRDRYRIGKFLKFHKKPNSQLFIASWCDLPDNVQRLLGHGAAVNGDVNSDSAKIIKPVQVAAIAGNLKILRLLLEKNASMTQSEFDTVVSENERHGADVLSSILEARPSFAITKDTVRRSYRNFTSTEMLKHILDKSDVVTEEILVELIREHSRLWMDDDLVHKILSRGDAIGCEKHRILQAFCRDSSCEGNIKLVMDRYKPPPSKSQEIVMWVIQNTRTSDSMLPVIFEYYRTVGVEVEFNQDMLVQAASSRSFAVQHFWTILDYAKSIMISDKVMRNIARNRSHSVIIMNLLMDHAGCAVKNFEGVLKEDIRFAVHWHIPTCPRQVSDKMAKSAARWSPSAIEYLQAHARPNVTFTKTPAEAESFGSDSDTKPLDSDAEFSD